jgi:hypothetical protein
MCKKTKGLHNRIDKCIKPLIRRLNTMDINTYACCCGHGKYPMTIICKTEKGNFYEFTTLTWILRKRKFYVKDKQGYYFIPECQRKKVNIKW